MWIDWKQTRVRLNNAGRIRTEPNWHIGERWSNRLRDQDIWYVWEGLGWMSAGQTEFTLRPGMCLWLRPGLLYRAHQDPKKRLGVTNVHFDLLTKGRCRDPGAPLPPLVIDLFDTALMEAATSRIIELIRDRPARWRPRANALTTVLLTELEAAAVTMRETHGGTERHHRDVVKRVMAHIEEDPRQGTDLDAMAADCGYSRGHFTRVFKTVAGRSPRSFLVDARIRRARHLLRESALNVSQVAEALGYCDVHFFSRQFKELTGLPPLAYRNTRTG